MNAWENRGFLFAVKRLRGLARVPSFPQIFDSLLLMGTCLFRRGRREAMERLEAEMLLRRGVSLAVHRFGGMEFVREGKELGHVHGHGLLDVRLSKAQAEALIAAGRVKRHHFLPNSGWVSFQMESAADVPWAVELLEMRKS